MVRVLKKTPKAPVSEEAIHANIARLLAIALPSDVMWWHTPNGGSRHKLEAVKFRRMGVKPGIPDLLLFDTQTGRLHCIEVKSAKGDLSADQRAWMKAYSASPAPKYAVARSVDDAIAILHDWWGDRVKIKPFTPAQMGAVEALQALPATTLAPPTIKAVSARLRAIGKGTP